VFEASHADSGVRVRELCMELLGPTRAVVGDQVRSSTRVRGITRRQRREGEGTQRSTEHGGSGAARCSGHPRPWG
jgi:hypothetical protein